MKLKEGARIGCKTCMDGVRVLELEVKFWSFIPWFV
jgi:hypothetical protein